MALGRNIDRIERNIESIESKFAKIFKRPKNREDGSDFDDFWTESIVSTQSIFSKIFERTKNYRIDRIDRFDRSVDRSIVSIDGRLDEAEPGHLPFSPFAGGPRHNGLFAAPACHLPRRSPWSDNSGRIDTMCAPRCTCTVGTGSCALAEDSLCRRRWGTCRPGVPRACTP